MADWTSDNGSYRTIGQSVYQTVGILVDIHTLYLDHDYEIRQLRVFKSLVENGILLRYNALVNADIWVS